MESFFSKFKDNLNADYGGRYLEVILSEVIREDVSILKILFPALDTNIIKSKNLDIDVEEIFPSRVKKHRRADLVVKQNGIHKALLEIKYDDKSHDQQIPDYIKYAKKHDICFTYLTQYIPSKKDLDAISANYNDKYVAILYKDLYKELKKRGKANKPVTNLFIDFMEEQFMIYNSEINNDVLALLLVKSLHVTDRHGLGKKVSDANVKSVPELWDTLINNVGILGDRFYNDFRKFFNNKFSIHFEFNPKFKLKTSNKDINIALKEEETSDYLCSERRIGGYFLIVASGKLKQKDSDNYLNLRIGYCFYLDLEQPKEKKISKYYHSSVYGRGFEIKENEKLIKSKGLPDEHDCYKQLLQLCRDSVNAVLENKDDLLKSFSKTLCELKTELNKSIKN